MFKRDQFSINVKKDQSVSMFKKDQFSINV